MAFRYLLFTLLISLAATLISTGGVSKKKVVCYLASWANYRTEGDGKGKYVIEDIDPYLCTHAIYAFAKLENNTIAVFDPYLDLEENWGLGGYKRFNNLRQKNPELKTLIAIGGWKEGSVNYSRMASSPANRTLFIESVINFLDKYGFGGLDIDWEYPTQRGGETEDKENFVLLLQELHDALKPKGYLLTAAVSAGKETIDSAYDIPRVSKYVDHIHVMTYDFHGAWEQRTGINSPLYGDKDKSVEQRRYTLDFAMKYWIENGASAEKLLIGFAFYGRTFTLKDVSKTGLGAPTIGKGGKAGIYTEERGSLGFNEICLHLTKDDWIQEWDNTSETPYAYKGDQWVTYDNERSIEIKVDYLKENNFAGAFIWSLDCDDFRGTCYGRKNYLLTILTDKLWKQDDVSD